MNVEAFDARLVGGVLLAIAPLFALEGIGYRGGYDARFWALPLDDKLDHIARHRRAWVWIGAMWIPMLAVITGGLVAFTVLLAEAGEGTLAGIGLGAYVLGAVAWFVAAVLQVAAIGHAADVRRETGPTPGWVQPLWNAGWWMEVTFIVLANLGYVAMGAAIVGAGFPGEWSGWVAISLGGLIAAVVLATRQGFPRLGVIVPFVLGVALVLE